LDLLLRAEQIVRITGDVPAPLSQRLTQLERDLAAPPWKAQPSCIPFSLPAGPALGYPRPTIQGDDFRAVSAEEDARRNDAWSAVAARLDRDRLRAGVSLAGADALLRFLVTDQKPDKAALDRGAELLKHVDVGQPRPVETQLLRTMQKQIPAPRDAELIRLALDVQVEAERTAWFVGTDKAHPYAEQVSRWFGKRLEALDKQRRDATDLVFAGEAKSGADARAGLEGVRKLYADLGRDAAALGAAFRLRDRVLARLPYYARWAAGRRVSADEAAPNLNRVRLTADKAQELVHALETPDQAGLAHIHNLTQDLDGTDDRPGQFPALETEFKTHLTTLRGEAVPSNWHAIDNALAVPFTPVQTRVELLGKLRSISRRLNDASEPGERGKSSPVDAREMAQRQGQMSRPVLVGAQETE